CMRVTAVDSAHAGATLALLDSLKVSLLGTSSARLHAALVADALAGRIDCRIALEAGEVRGVVLAAPASYWRAACLWHWAVATECVMARLTARRPHGHARARFPAAPFLPPSAAAGVTWRRPGAAWRVIFVGTAEAARGRGIAAALYRSVMRDRSLV